MNTRMQNNCSPEIHTVMIKQEHTLDMDVVKQETVEEMETNEDTLSKMELDVLSRDDYEELDAPNYVEVIHAENMQTTAVVKQERIKTCSPDHDLTTKNNTVIKKECKYGEEIKNEPGSEVRDILEHPPSAVKSEKLCTGKNSSNIELDELIIKGDETEADLVCNSSRRKRMKYLCDQCDYCGTNARKFRSHRIKEHIKAVKDYSCKICSKTYTNGRYLQRHNSRMHHKNSSVKCNMCSYKTNQPDVMKLHVESHNNGRITNKFKCELCSYSGNEAWCLKLHIKKIHAGIKNFPCEVCKEMFITEQDMQLHRKQYHDVTNFRCGNCSKYYASQRYLDDHTKLKICLPNSDAPNRLNENDEETNVNKYKCELCDYKGKWNWSLKKHIQNKHEGAKNFECEDCKTKFVTKLSMQRHKKRMHDLTDFQCKLCSKYYSSQANLNIHAKETACGTNTVHPDSVDESHSGKFKCGLCPYRAKNDRWLNQHIKSMHDGVKNFECDECSQMFITEQNMLRHKRQYHNETDFQCTMCMKFFGFRPNLWRHMKSCSSSDMTSNGDAAESSSN